MTKAGDKDAAGDQPQVTIKILNAATGVAINPSSIVEPVISTNVQPSERRAAELYVYGPRARSVPVLTTAAALNSPTTSRAVNDLRVRQNPANEDPAVTRTAEAII